MAYNISWQFTPFYIYGQSVRKISEDQTRKQMNYPAASGRGIEYPNAKSETRQAAGYSTQIGIKALPFVGEVDPQLEKVGWYLSDYSKVNNEIPANGYNAEPWNRVTDYTLYREMGEVLAVDGMRKTFVGLFILCYTKH